VGEEYKHANTASCHCFKGYNGPWAVERIQMSFAHRWAQAVNLLKDASNFTYRQV